MLLTTCPVVQNARSLEALVVITQNLFLQDHWELETLICGLDTTAECCYTLVPQALCSFSCSCHLHWVNIQLPAQKISYPAPDPPGTKFNPQPSGKCEYPQPAQVISAHQHINISHVLVS